MDSFKANAFVFDVDGTLLDTEKISTQALCSIVEPFGGEFTWEIKKMILGMPASLWAPIVIRECGIEGKVLPENMGKQWVEYMNEHCHEADILPGALEVVQKAKEFGMPLACATSSYASQMKTKSANHPELFGLFDIIVTGDDAEVLNGKPNPDIFLVAAKRLGVKPESCVAFEDAATGVTAAHSAGMRVIAIPDPRIENPVFEEKSHEVLKTLEQFEPSQYFY
eukprot:TRINITY_DN8695_c0_g1_i1.p1 TRINITY_DN8695_c0_g1~~TRINITY_DN8695_c0_g1_i1.p1  ORF type:complete len:224 (-),score=67.74 TRINITY_DN8695_c0_g1_i1:200-871(-)